MRKELLKSQHLYCIFKTIYENGWSYFTLSQLVKPYTLDKGNTIRYLQKLCSTGLLSKLEGSNVYLIDREDITVQTVFRLIQIQELNLTYRNDNHLFLKYETFFRNQRLHHSRVEGAPFFLSIVCEAESTDEPRKRGCHHKFIPYLMQDGHIDRYLRYEDLHQVTSLLFEAAAAGDADYFDHRIDARKDDWVAFDEYVGSRGDMDQRDTKRLAQELSTYGKQYINAMSRSSILEACRFDFIPAVVRHVTAALQTTCPIQETEVMQILTAAPYQTYINETNLRILELALDIQTTYPDLSQQIRTQGRSEDLLGTIESCYPLLADALQGFRNNFYQGISFARTRQYSLEDLFTSFQTIFDQDLDLLSAIHDLRQKPTQHKTALRDFLKNHTFDHQTSLLIAFVQTAVRLKNTSTRIVQKLTYRGTRLLENAAQRKGCSFEMVTSMSYDEVLLYLHGLIEPDEDQLLQRRHYSLCLQKGHAYHFYLGEEATHLHHLLLQEADLNFTGMRGAVVNAGLAVGPANVFMSSHYSACNKHDIIVARHMDDCMERLNPTIGALLLEEETMNDRLLAFAHAHPHIPIITHVKGLTTYIQSGDIIHVDGDFGRVTILEKVAKSYGLLYTSPHPSKSTASLHPVPTPPKLT